MVLKEVVKDIQALSAYLEEKAKGHNCYKIYTVEDRIDNIVEHTSLYLSDGHKWNDLQDRNSLNNNRLGYKNFAICFSFSKSENIAMWMLYGGMEKRGMMINFKPSMINDCIQNNKQIELGCFDKGKFKCLQTLDKKDYKIKLVDVLYYGDATGNQSGYRVKRSDEYCDGITHNDFFELNDCVKSYSWSHENECRIIVSVSKNLISDFKIDTVKLTLSEDVDMQHIAERIILAPNYAGNRQYNRSVLSNTIDWDLCRDCQYKGLNTKCNNRQNTEENLNG